MKNYLKTVLYRFIRGFFAGAIATMAVITANGMRYNFTTWSDLGSALSILAISGTMGGIVGGIMALDKAYRMK